MWYPHPVSRISDEERAGLGVGEVGLSIGHGSGFGEAIASLYEATGLDCRSPMPRIVSFLPAGTEIVAALGAGDQLVGRSHECDHPASIRELPIVSRPALELGGLTQAEVDSAVHGPKGNVERFVHARRQDLP